MSAPAALLAKFDDVRSALRGELLRRDEEIEMALLALTSRNHVFYLGKPGEAKTYLADRLVLRIAGVRFFAEQMRKTLPPEALFGPISVPALKEERWRYVTDGYLPWADLAAIDEVWKGNGPALNGMLGIWLERRFRNDGQWMSCPLSTVICASNEMPEEDGSEALAAIWDRILLRTEVASPTDESDLRALISLPKPDPAPPTVIDWVDILTAQELSAAIPLSDAAVDAYMEVLRALGDAGIEPSPRRIRMAPDAARAAAFLAGADKVEPEHLECFTHVFWERPDQIRTVERTVLSLVAPGQSEALEMSDTVAELIENLDAALALTPAERSGQLNELFDKFRTVKGHLDGMSHMTGRAARTVAETEAALVAGQRRLLTEGFGTDLSALG